MVLVRILILMSKSGFEDEDIYLHIFRKPHSPEIKFPTSQKQMTLQRA
jgi:hypothetical protein